MQAIGKESTVETFIHFFSRRITSIVFSVVLINNFQLHER